MNLGSFKAPQKQKSLPIPMLPLKHSSFKHHQIKASNEASKKIFSDVGFKYIKNIDNNFLQYMLDLNL